MRVMPDKMKGKPDKMRAGTDKGPAFNIFRPDSRGGGLPVTD